MYRTVCIIAASCRACLCPVFESLAAPATFHLLIPERPLLIPNMSDSSVHAVAGALGGIVSTAATYPLINVSMRAQVTRRQGKDASTTDALREILRTEGIQGLFTGVTSNLLGIAVSYSRLRSDLADVGMLLPVPAIAPVMQCCDPGA